MTSKRTGIFLASLLLLVILLPTAQALTLTKLSDPATIPTGAGYKIAFSPDGRFMAVPHDVSPYVSIYEITAGPTFTKLANPATLPSNSGAVAFSPDSSMLAVTSTSGTALLIYQITGTTFTKLADPAVLPAGSGLDVDWSDDGLLLAVAHIGAPYVTIYTVSGTTFTKVSDPAVLPAGNGWGVDFSPSGDFLAVAHENSPYVSFYLHTGVSTFTKQANPATLPTGTGRNVHFSPAEDAVAIAHTTSPYLTIYPVVESTDDIGAKLSDPATLPAGNARGLRYSPGGDFLAVAHGNSPFVSVYAVSGTTYTKEANPATLPSVTGGGAGWSADASLLAVGHGGSPYVNIYSTGLTFTAGETPDPPTGLSVRVTQVPGVGHSLMELRWSLSDNDPDQDQGSFDYQVWVDGTEVATDTVTSADGDGQRFHQLDLAYVAPGGGAYDSKTYIIWVRAVNGFLASANSCSVTINDASLNTKTCGTGAVGVSPSVTVPGANSDVGDGIVGFCAALMGDSTASLFFCGLIFVVVVFLAVAAAFAALAGGPGLPAAIGGSIVALGFMVFNIFVGLWEIWAGAVLIILASAVVGLAVKALIFGKQAVNGLG